MDTSSPRVEPHSDTWQAIVAHADARLKELRSELETPGTESDRADILRGEIAALKTLLALPQTQNKPTPDKPETETYGFAAAEDYQS